MHSVADRLR